MSIVETLNSFKTLSENKSMQLDLLKDKKIVLYAATLLDNDDTEVLNLCLDILENFAENEETHAILLSTFGIYESVESLSIHMRDKDKNIFQRAVGIAEKLRNSTTNSHKKLKHTKRQHVFFLHVEGLNGENLLNLEEILVKIKGIVSFLIDIELKRLTVRICQRLEIRELVNKIYSKTNLNCSILVRNNKTGLEERVDLLSTGVDAYCTDPSKSYLAFPEDYSHGGKAIAESARKIVQSGNNVIKSMVNFWNDAFYW
ncbi:unnamed protein product [Phyllotreta striolata]|uniref:Uncharacterized protein n=1 Tax=Phyllotreta striolata TaxID=444603 RepID=A0A9N9XNI8_PHYSR|nr:unnamed protein product [Phyllotreta striolata]